ncbi:MAG: DUF1549 domain-containing protein [Verrucomicrobia bacterium]|nr:DUF1549 domain-containing protein [Verrucomicrobiota bacterium]
MKRIIPTVLLMTTLAAPRAADSIKTEPVSFNRDVLPILAENCFTWHGFEKTARKAGLRLDQRETATALLKSGARAIVPGDVKNSELIRRITSDDRDEMMPPPQTGKRLTPAQKKIVRRWITAGARYEPHWAFIPPQRVEPPKVAGSTQAIDRFIRARLAMEKVQPSPEADRATLIRRLSFDLTGLPPAPLEVDAFLNDTRPDAYQRVVERLLASEHFGEKWARWWLDLAHYADSDGYLQDFVRPTAWRYRQWVVDAFNRDQPFDQFTIEQLAGDLLPDASASQRVATGFLRNTLSNREGGADLEEYRVRQVIDRTATTGATWMALTVGCAECHDHKFDPLTQREFYRLYAFFNDADEVNFNAPLPGEREPWERAKTEHDHKRAELIAPVAGPLAELQAAWEKRLLEAEAHPGGEYACDRALEVMGLVWGQGEGEGQLEGINIMKTPIVRRTQEQMDRLLNYFLSNGSLISAKKFKELKLGELATKLNALAKELPAVSRAPVIGASAHRARHGEPAVAGIIWARPRRHDGKLRCARRAAVAPRVARLAGAGVSEPALEPQGNAPAHGCLADLPAILRRAARTCRARPAQRARRAAGAAALVRRGGARRCACGEWFAQSHRRRPERQAATAGERQQGGL